MRTRRDHERERAMTLGRIRLLPEALISLPVFGFSFLWVALVQLGEWAALGDDPGNLIVRLASVFAVQVLMFAFPFVTLRFICPRLRTASWNWVLLCSVIVGAFVRGVALGFVFTWTGVTASPEFVFRVAASISHLAVITIILWYLVSEVRGLHALRRQLIGERAQLLDLQEDAQRDLEQLGERATEGIRRSVLESLGGLQTTDSTVLLERLRITIDEVVRPLSHQLAGAGSAWTPPQPPTPTMGVDWPLAIREGLDPVRIRPIIVPVLLIWIGLPIHLFQFGPRLTAGLIATLIITIPVFWLARKAAIRLTVGRGTGAKAAGFVIAVLVGGLALGLATLLYMQGQPQPYVFVVVAPPLALLIAAPIAIAQAARDQDVALAAELQATTEDLRWTLARTRERHRQQEGALARALHGRLQAALAAAFLRLDRAVAEGADDDALRTALQTEVHQAITELDVVATQPDPIEKVVALTRSNWSGTVHLDIALDEWACDALSGDPLCARSVNDLLPELVFNSIKHGSATAITVRLDVADERTLRLTVIDDGSADLITSRYGLGSTLLDEASISWTRTRADGRTTTTCVLPFMAGSPALVTL